MTAKKDFGPKGWTPERLGSLAGKTYVITGANNGAGFEATRVFLSRGAKVVMMNRNADKSTTAIATLKQEFGSDADVTFVRMDLGVLNSVRKAASDVCNGRGAGVPKVLRAYKKITDGRPDRRVSIR